MRSDNEDELIARAKSGDVAAFDELLVPYLPMLFAYSRAICGDHHAAQDVVQETAVVAFRNLHHLFLEADFAGWLRAIARRQSLAARRKLTRVNLVAEEVLERAYLDAESDSEDPRLDAVGECLKRLAGRMQQVVRGHYFDGRRLDDLAKSLAMTMPAVKQLLYRSRLWLRECVEKRLSSEGPV